MMSDLLSTQARAISSRLRLELIQAATPLQIGFEFLCFYHLHLYLYDSQKTEAELLKTYPANTEAR